MSRSLLLALCVSLTVTTLMGESGVSPQVRPRLSISPTTGVAQRTEGAEAVEDVVKMDPVKVKGERVKEISELGILGPRRESYEGSLSLQKGGRIVKTRLLGFPVEFGLFQPRLILEADERFKTPNPMIKLELVRLWW